ncbi:MAG: hypothetical protein AAB268_11695, partial [Elusimicrobiota bacterium]
MIAAMEKCEKKGFGMAVLALWAGLLLLLPLNQAAADPPGAPGVPVQLDPKKPLAWGQMPGGLALLSPKKGREAQ